MSRTAILGAGAVALVLLAVVCIPHHLPTTPASMPLTPATFHARLEHGTLTLRGSLPSETSKAAILHRAQELYGATPGRVVDELAVDPRVGPASWAGNVPKVLPILGYMTERGSIIIDGHSLVLSGRVRQRSCQSHHAAGDCSSYADGARTGRSYSSGSARGSLPLAPEETE